MKDTVQKKITTDKAEGKGPPGEVVAPWDSSIRVRLGKTTETLSESDLKDPDTRAAWRKKLSAAKKPAVFEIDGLLNLDDEARFVALRLTAEPADAKFRAGGELAADLLEGVLKLAVTPTDTKRVRALKMTVLEVGVLRYGDALDLVSGRLADRLKKLKVPGVSTAQLLQDAKQIQAEVRHASQGAAASQGQPGVPVRQAVETAPVGPEVVVPPGWEIKEAGVFKRGDTPALVVPTPLVIVNRARDVNRREELTTIAFRRDGTWAQKTVERVEVADAKRLVGLANTGVPVTSNNSKVVVQYLSEFEAANEATLPLTKVSRQLGWQGPKGENGFLLGSHFVNKGGVVKADGAKGTVLFRGGDEGDDQIAQGVQAEGTLEGWLEAVAALKDYPRVRFGLYAAFAPPLLPILGSSNFTVSFAGETTGGKTVTLRVCGSVWGNPDETSPSSIVFTWDGTAVWRERAPAVLSNLPLILDDTKRARRREDVEQTIYDVSSGRGRGRGSARGLARQMSWQTVLLTTGEQPTTSFTQAGGTRARVLEVWGSPFGVKDQETGTRVRKLNQRVKQHYGHAGPAFVQHALKNRAAWGTWKKRYRTLVKEYEEQAGDNALANRMAEHFAVLRLTAELVHEAIDLPWPDADPVEPLYEVLVAEVGEADRPAAAARHVMAWATAHQADFFRPNAKETRQPPGGWAGVWPLATSPSIPPGKQKLPPWEYVGFLPQKLRLVLQEGGFDDAEIVRNWKDRNWLHCTKEEGAARTRLKVKLDNQPTWVVALTYEGAVAAKAV